MIFALHSVFPGVIIATTAFYLFVFHSFNTYLLSVYYMLCTYQRNKKKISPWSHKACILVVQDKQISKIYTASYDDICYKEK